MVHLILSSLLDIILSAPVILLVTLNVRILVCIGNITELENRLAAEKGKIKKLKRIGRQEAG